MGVKINGIEYQVDKFAYDGCHKIYLIESESDERAAVGGCGYALYDVHDLPDAWEDSCPLRFISTWSLDAIIPQCYESEVAFAFTD